MSPSATVVVKTSAAELVPLEYVATSLFDRVIVGVPVTTTVSPQVTVIEIVSPTPYAASAAATLLSAGTLASTTTAPKSPEAIAVAKLLSASSWIEPPLAAIEDTERSAESVSPDPTV